MTGLGDSLAEAKEKAGVDITYTERDRELFMKNIYHKFIDNVIENLMDRFLDNLLISSFNIFDPDEANQDQTNRLEILCEHFATEVTADEVHTEYRLLSPILGNQYKDLKTSQVLRCVMDSHGETMPNLAKLAAAISVTPLSTADCERGFSAMNQNPCKEQAEAANLGQPSDDWDGGSTRGGKADVRSESTIEDTEAQDPVYRRGRLRWLRRQHQLKMAAVKRTKQEYIVRREHGEGEAEVEDGEWGIWETQPDRAKNCLSRHNGPTTWSMTRLEEKGIKRGEGGRVYLQDDPRFQDHQGVLPATGQGGSRSEFRQCQDFSTPSVPMEVGDPSTELPSPPPGESTRLSDRPDGSSLAEDWSPSLVQYLDREFSLVGLQSVRTNDDVEGWHTRLNLKAKKAALLLYLLIDLLHREGRLVWMQTRQVCEGQLRRYQRTAYKNLQGRLFEAWLAAKARPEPVISHVPRAAQGRGKLKGKQDTYHTVEELLEKRVNNSQTEFTQVEIFQKMPSDPKAMLVYRALGNSLPPHMRGVFIRYRDAASRSTRQSTLDNLIIPRPQLEVYRRSLRYSGATVWNSLPPHESETDDKDTWMIRSPTWRSKRLNEILLLCDTELDKKPGRNKKITRRVRSNEPCTRSPPDVRKVYLKTDEETEEIVKIKIVEMKVVEMMVMEQRGVRKERSVKGRGREGQVREKVASMLAAEGQLMFIVKATAAWLKALATDDHVRYKAIMLKKLAATSIITSGGRKRSPVREREEVQDRTKRTDDTGNPTAGPSTRGGNDDGSPTAGLSTRGGQRRWEPDRRSVNQGGATTMGARPPVCRPGGATTMGARPPVCQPGGGGQRRWEPDRRSVDQGGQRRWEPDRRSVNQWGQRRWEPDRRSVDQGGQRRWEPDRRSVNQGGQRRWEPDRRSVNQGGGGNDARSPTAGPSTRGDNTWRVQPTQETTGGETTPGLEPPRMPGLRMERGQHQQVYVSPDAMTRAQGGKSTTARVRIMAAALFTRDELLTRTAGGDAKGPKLDTNTIEAIIAGGDAKGPKLDTNTIEAIIVWYAKLQLDADQTDNWTLPKGLAALTDGGAAGGATQHDGDEASDAPTDLIEGICPIAEGPGISHRG
ncbi:hypothetical protein Bbelb_349760 [Branchiostoma belcheri]|nr:hypothetical protein Bbelb_349760 [Branchiostoma belcheri]